MGTALYCITSALCHTKLFISVVGLLGQCGFWRDVLANVCGRTGPQEEQEKAAESQLTHEPSQQPSGQKGKKLL
jgi:hypothetical protein